MVQLNFDATTVDPSEKREYPQLPRAWYSAYIDESIMKDTKAKQEGKNNNEYLQLRFALLDWAENSPMPMDIKISGRKFYARLNIKNSNKDAVEIAYRDLSAIGHAVGVTSITTSDLLHDKPLEVFLEEELDNKGNPVNAITAYRACNSGGDQLQKMAEMNQNTDMQGQQNNGSKKALWE